MSNCEKCKFRATYDKNPRSFLGASGNGISAGARAGNPISSHCRMRKEERLLQNIVRHNPDKRLVVRYRQFVVDLESTKFI